MTNRPTWNSSQRSWPPAPDPDLVAVVLAAGEGKRMKSSLVKVLHPLRGRPLVQHVLDAVRGAGASRVIVVVGVQAGLVEARLRAELEPCGVSTAPKEVEFVHQERPLGTAHAVLVTRPLLEEHRGDVLVVYGDTPLLDPGDLRVLVETRRRAGAALAFLTTYLADPTGYGRVIRDGTGRVAGIVEEADCTLEQRRVNEVNAGVYCFAAPRLWGALEQVGQGNAQGEFYLTDAVKVLLSEGEAVVAVPVRPERMVGINDRLELARVELTLRRAHLEGIMRQGVTVVDPASAFLDDRVEAEPDVVIGPGTVVEGQVRIRKGASLGPLAIIRQRDRR